MVFKSGQSFLVFPLFSFPVFLVMSFWQWFLVVSVLNMGGFALGMLAHVMLRLAT
jgi:hypothetical protein